MPKKTYTKINDTLTPDEPAGSSAIEKKLDRIIELLESVVNHTDRVPKPFDWSKVVKD